MTTMSSNTVHTAEVLISNLATKSVTLAPRGATVIREIQDIQLMPGPNELTVFGLDPRVDLDSIRVDGHGPATITDLQTEIVPRREQFEDAYIHGSEDEDEDDISELDSDNDYGVDKSELEAAQRKVMDVQAILAADTDRVSAAAMALQFLDHYGRSMKADDVEVSKVTDFLNLYEQRRAALASQNHESSTNVTDLQEQAEKWSRTVYRLNGAFEKAKKVASREARREKQRKRKEREQKREQRRRELEERRRFWTSHVSQVVVSMDAFSGQTPSSSRRNSILLEGKGNEVQDTVSLCLTYVILNAYWAPRYELSINTPSSICKVVYRAEFQNLSTETWNDTKVVLSTSQTSFSGLDEKIPTLEAWHVKLAKSEVNVTGAKAVWTDGLESNREIRAKMAKSVEKSYAHSHQPVSTKSRRSIKGAAAAPPPSGLSQGEPVELTRGKGFEVFSANSSDIQRGLFGRLDPIDELQLSAAAASDDDNIDSDIQTLAGSSNLLTHQESLRQDYGLTTTYDLPGHRSLAPSSVKRRHVIAELELPSVALSYVLIPKLRPAAFLKAKIKNTTSVSLLRGRAGMTVDETFLGSTTLPTCSPDSFFNLSLGVDPAILVTYAKPIVRRATSGFFNKEDSAVFTRVCSVKNTKQTAVSILVFDQVPMSEDEKLRVNILNPRGLDKEGDKKNLESSKEKWGTGTVALGKNGELKWEINLEKGKETRLTLEYEARIPSGQKIVGWD